ncbi:hypothetical protein [Mucilaginibacter sp.]|jgi:hypothetical protein|uniref:hypothetical protein n=1 Tax=Mucilaginibacter sp. TaxID=1882438 RepID=UPI0026182E39|nr:hypothetical protein [Mucilaginibacter sp.]MDB5129322.1 hypothetical protein [Mucilaginibacter sp.]
MRIINRLIISIVILLIYVQAVRAQEILKLDLDEQVNGVAKTIAENIYSKKSGNQKFIKIFSKTTPYAKPEKGSYSYITRLVNLKIYYSDEEHFTNEPSKDTVNRVCIDAFNKDGNMFYTYWMKKTGDSVVDKDTIYKIQYQFRDSFQKTGYIKINSDKKIEWRRTYGYNKQQLLSLIADYETGTTLNRKIKIDYLLFDPRGNWIKRKETTTLKDGTIAGITIVKRIITYY